MDEGRGAVLTMSLCMANNKIPSFLSQLPEQSLTFTLQAVSFGGLLTAQRKDLNKIKGSLTKLTDNQGTWFFSKMANKDQNKLEDSQLEKRKIKKKISK